MGPLPLDAARGRRVRDDRHRAVPAAHRGRGAAAAAAPRAAEAGVGRSATRSRTAATAVTSAGWPATSTPRSSATRTRRRSASDMAGKDLNAILGPVGRQHVRPAGRRFGVRRRRRRPAFSPPPPPSFASPPPPPPPSFSPPPMPSFAPPPPPSFAPPQPFNAASLGFGGGGGERVRGDGRRTTCRCRARPGRPAPGDSRCRTCRPRADAPGELSDGDATRVVPYDPDEEEEAPLPPHLRRLHRQEARLRRVDGRPDARQVPAEAARQQGEPGREAQLPHGPIQRLREGRQGGAQGDADPRVSTPESGGPSALTLSRKRERGVTGSILPLPLAGEGGVRANRLRRRRRKQ